MEVEKEHKKRNIHAEHRKRMKNKYKLHGVDIFEKHEILELALFYAIPRKDTNEIAHRLLKKFETIHDVMNAPFATLREVEGIGEEAACFIKFLVDIVRVYMEEKASSKDTYRSREELNERLSMKFIGREIEIVSIILVDAKRKIIYEGIVSKGSHNSVDMYMRRIIELIVLYNAAGIVVGHNHPSGIALPSPQDIETTKKLDNVLHNMNVTFLDHIIVADDDFVSLRDAGLPGLFS